jgi:hypothetical protein
VTEAERTTGTESTQPAAGTTSAARRRPAGQTLRTGLALVRARLAALVWLAAVVCALLLAIGALVVALKMNQHNAIVSFVTDAANKLDFGEFKKFHGQDAATKSALVNWGIAAVIYLVIGKVLDRLIRP